MLNGKQRGLDQSSSRAHIVHTNVLLKQEWAYKNYCSCLNENTSLLSETLPPFANQIGGILHCERSQANEIMVYHFGK